VKGPWHTAVEIGRCQRPALCSIRVCGAELTKPCTKEIVGRLMGSTYHRPSLTSWLPSSWTHRGGRKRWWARNPSSDGRSNGNPQASAWTITRSQPCRSDVRYGSKADIGVVQIYVCFTPESGHGSEWSWCPLCAWSDLCRL